MRNRCLNFLKNRFFILLFFVGLLIGVIYILVDNNNKTIVLNNDANTINSAASHARPSMIYKPSKKPGQLANRPDISSLLSSSPVISEEENQGALDSTIDLSEEDIIIEPIEIIPQISKNDPAILKMMPESNFAEKVWNGIQSGKDLINEGNLFLGSKDSAERAYGAILLYEANALNDEVLDVILSDSDAIVPLTLYDWIRDYGSNEDVNEFSNALTQCEFTEEELYSYIMDSSSTIGGGRSALDLWLSSFEVGQVPVDKLSNIMTSSGASYDVRSQALFKLFEPETKHIALESIDKMAKGIDPLSGELLKQSIDKWQELAIVANSEGDTEKIWDSESAVVLYLAESEKGLAARDLANYLEYALRRDDPVCDPVIELGTWEFANEFLEKTLQEKEELMPIELDALDRIAVSLDRLVNYDPAFNPFEEVGENEVVPEEFFEEEVSDDSIEE